MTDLTFAIGEVAAMLGMSAHTIRAWERRHRALKPSRTASGQRRYTGDDVELLRQIKRERRLHCHSLRVATLMGQGLITLDRGDDHSPRAETPPIEVERGTVRIMANFVSDLVIVLDEGGRIAHANTAFVRFVDVMPARLRGVPLADFVDPFDRAKAVQVYRAPLRQRRGWELNLRGARRRRLFSFDCWPASSSQGGQVVLVGREVGDATPDFSDGSLPEAVPAPALAAPPPSPGRASLPEGLWPLLDGAPDPVRVLRLFGAWLDATPVGVAMLSAPPACRALMANRAFRAMVGGPSLPAEGQAPAAWWAREDLERVAAAGELAISRRSSQSVLGWSPAAAGGDGRRPVWDLELLPVSDASGAVSHLLLTLSDVSAEAAVASRLAPLLAGLPVQRPRDAPEELLRAAARRAKELVPNDGVLLALVQPPANEQIVVVAGSGRWAGVDAGAREDLRLGLVRRVVRLRAPAELSWDDGSGGTETHRISPVLHGGPPGHAPVAGVLAFVRTGADSFTADDRDIIDEFGDRLGLLLASAAAGSRSALSS